MHLLGLIFGPFELKDPCMDVKFVTLRVISTLRGHIYLLDEMSLTEIKFMDMYLVESASYSWDSTSRVMVPRPLLF